MNHISNRFNDLRTGLAEAAEPPRRFVAPPLLQEEGKLHVSKQDCYSPPTSHKNPMIDEVSIHP